MVFGFVSTSVILKKSIFFNKATFWATTYMNETGRVFEACLANIYLNIIEFCFSTVKTNIPRLLVFFKYDWYHQFKICVDLIGYDRPGKKFRFTVIYYLISLVFNNRLHLFTQTDELNGLLSNFMIYKSLN
jgi:NADH:ubiquinone oxidoreductase subunit C